jgi:hypothetical protein
MGSLQVSLIANSRSNVTIRFKHVSKSASQKTFAHLQDKSNQLAQLKEIEQKLQIKQPTDWYNYDAKDVRDNGGRILMHRIYNNSLITMLKSLYPEVDWEISK